MCIKIKRTNRHIYARLLHAPSPLHPYTYPRICSHTVYIFLYLYYTQACKRCHIQYTPRIRIYTIPSRSIFRFLFLLFSLLFERVSFPISRSLFPPLHRGGGVWRAPYGNRGRRGPKRQHVLPVSSVLAVGLFRPSFSRWLGLPPKRAPS